MVWTVCDVRPSDRPSDPGKFVGPIDVKIGTWVHFVV